jgi:hypothetical protein
MFSCFLDFILLLILSDVFNFLNCGFIGVGLARFFQHQKVYAEKELDKYWTSARDTNRTISGKFLHSETFLLVIDCAAGFVCSSLCV